MIGVAVTWEADANAQLREWRIYASRSKDVKGRLYVIAAAADRAAVLKPVTEGTLHVRVISVDHVGIEEDWRTVLPQSIGITRQKLVADTPSVAIAPSARASVVSVAVEPITSGDDAEAVVELIQGPDEFTGQRVGDVAASQTPIAYGPTPTPQRGDVNLSSDGVNSTLQLHARAVLVEGRSPSSTAVSVDVPTWAPENRIAIELATLTGATYSGIRSPDSTAPWVVHGGQGITLLTIGPDTSLTTANGWGTSEDPTSRLLGVHCQARFMLLATVRTEWLDLGATKSVSIEAYDGAQRKSATASVEALYLDVPANPFDDPAAFDAGYADLSPWFLSRYMRSDGKCLRPLDRTPWEIRHGLSTGSSVEWRTHVPGEMIRGRYVQMRATFADPLGQHQVIVPRIRIVAWQAYSETPIVPQIAGLAVPGAGTYYAGAVDGVVQWIAAP